MSLTIKPNIEQNKTECMSFIDQLYDRYKDNTYMLQRIYNHVSTYLPNTLENESKNFDKRQHLMAHLYEEQHIFMQVFLCNNNYYYLQNNNSFYEYDGATYFMIKEDEITHKLLSTISKERVLLPWKHKTKSSVFKQIKERHLFSSTPNTETIQHILNAIYPAIFDSKNAAKYFLTILGDSILKKHTDITFLVSPKIRQFLDDLELAVFMSIGNNNAAARFVTKYHETHLFQNCRLIKINENYSRDYWRDILNKNILNLVCVAAHYSNRYQISDNFLNSKADEELVKYAYILKNTTQSDLITHFIDKCIEPTTEEYTIEWKNLHFIWKQFLSSLHLPNVIYSNSLKTILKQKLTYNESLDAFVGITSKYLPLCKDFIQFWNTTITTTESLEFDNEFEIDELCWLFKAWSNKLTVSEDTIIKILKHFYAAVEIIEDKYILNVTSSIWNKIADIDNSFEFIKTHIKRKYSKHPNNKSLLEFDELYTGYTTHCSQAHIKFIVSKRYFEKYLNYKLRDYITYGKFIKMDWLYI